MAERRVDVRFSIVGADASRNDIGKIRTAADELGDEFAAAGQKIVKHLENIQDQYDRVASKSDQGKKIVAGDTTVMVQQFAALETSITAAFGSLENAPKQFQDAFQNAQQQLNATTDKVRQSTAAVKDHSSELTQAGERWTGLGDAVNKAAGPYGAILGKLGLITVAFQQGWQIGTKFAKETGADMSTLERTTDEFKTRLGEMNNQLSNAAVSLFAGNLKEAGLSAVAAGRALDLSREALQGYTIALQFGVGEAEKYIKKADELVELHKLYATATAAGEEGQRLLYQAWNEADGSVKKFMDELRKVKPELDALKLTTDQAREAERKRQEAVGEGIKQIEAVLSALAKEKAARKAGTESLDAEMGAYQNLKTTLEKARDAIAAQEDAVGGLTGTVVTLLQNLDMMLEKQILNSKAADAFASGLKTAAEDYGSKIDPAKKQEILRLAESLEKYELLDAAQKQLVATQVNQLQAAQQASNVVWDAATKTMSNVKEGASNLQVVWAETAEKTQEAAVKVKTAVDIYDEVKTKLDSLFGFAEDEGINQLNTTLDEVATKMESLAASGVKKLTDALSELKTVAEEAGAALEKAANAGME